MSPKVFSGLVSQFAKNMKLDEGSSVRVSNLLNDFRAISWEVLEIF